MTVHLLIPDQHAHPEHSNQRASLLGQLLVDLKPDCVVNMGDCADLASLSSYDKGTRGFAGRSYQADIDAHLDFQSRLWEPIRRSKKRLPRRIVLEGNHEHRVERALDLQPILEGTISFKDFDFERYYDNIVRYDGNTPGIIEVDGVQYAHYFVSGLLGRPISSEHSAYTLLAKRHTSSTASHSHLLDYCIRRNSGSRTLQALVAGAFIDYRTSWAGQSEDTWWNGVVIKRNVENGTYDPEFVSLNRLKEIYGKVN